MTVTSKRSGNYIVLYKNGVRMASYNIIKDDMRGATKYFSRLKKEIRKRLKR